MRNTIIMGLIGGVLLVCIVAKPWRVAKDIRPANGKEPQSHVGQSDNHARDHGETNEITVKNGRFFDSKFNCAGIVPENWQVRWIMRPGPNEASISLVQASNQQLSLLLYYRMEKPAGSDTVNLLQAAIRDKTEQRINTGFVNYKVASEPVSHTLKGSPAVSWSANFTFNEEPWQEQLTRIQSHKYVALFSLITPARQAQQMRSAYNQFIAAAVFP
jgi:hypothetical protein